MRACDSRETCRLRKMVALRPFGDKSEFLWNQQCCWQQCVAMTVPLNQYHRKSGKLHGIRPLAERTRRVVDGSVIGVV